MPDTITLEETSDSAHATHWRIVDENDAHVGFLHFYDGEWVPFVRGLPVAKGSASLFDAAKAALRHIHAPAPKVVSLR